MSTKFYSYEDCISGPHYSCGTIELREIGLVGSSTSDARYVPRINFHWGNRVASTLYRDANGHFNFGDAGGGYGSTVRAVSFQSMSDARLKENLVPLDASLEKISQLTGFEFSFADIGTEDRKIGLMAQDVERLFPEAVSQNSEGYLSVDYSALLAPLIEAVKQLNDENENLRIDLEELRVEFQKSQDK